MSFASGLLRVLRGHSRIRANRAIRKRLRQLVIEGLERREVFAAFTPGNLVVQRMGDGGTTALGSTAQAIAVLEYATGGGNAIQTITFTGLSSSNALQTDSGSATSNGYLNFFGTTPYLSVPGYNSALGTASVASTNTKVNSILGLDGNVATRTTFPTDATIFGGNNYRSSIATGSSTFYATGNGSGTTGGVWYYNGSAFTQISSTVTNLRNVEIYNNQLYVSSSSGTFVGISSVGTGLPTTTGQTTTLQINIGSGASPYGFVMFDTDGNGSVDRAYVADDRTTTAGGILRFDFNSTNSTWSQTGSAFRFNTTTNLLSNATTGVVSIRGLTGSYNPSTGATLYATTTDASNNRLISFVDTSTNASTNGLTTTTSFTTVATAGTNYAFRGVDLTPASTTPTITGGATTTAFTTTYGTASTVQTFAIGGSNLTANITATAPPGFEVSSNGTTYGSTATFTQSGGSVSGSLRIRLAATATVDGSYNSQKIVLSSTGATDVNITTPSSGNTVSKKALTITANNQTVSYGTAVQTVLDNGSYTPSGFANGDGSSVIGGTATYTTTYTDTTAAGTNVATITPVITNLTATNYSFTAANGNISVTAVVPTAPTITAITAGDNQLSVAFDIPSSNGGASISNYEYSTNNGSTWTTPNPAVTASPLVITGLTNGTTYDVRIRAVNSAGSGAASNMMQGTPQAPASPTITVSPSTFSDPLTTTYGTASGNASFTVSGSALSGNITVTAPSGLEVSLTSTSGFANSLDLTPTAGTVGSTTVYARLKATANAGNYNSTSITVSSGGAETKTVSTSASGNMVSTKSLTIIGIGIADKTYDGGTGATITGTPSYSGLVNGDSFSVSGTPTATFADKNKGDGKSVTVSGYDKPSDNYTVTQPSGLTANITAKALTLPDAAVTSKPYDGTPAATITGNLSGIVVPDIVTLVGTGTFASSNAGNGISVTSTSSLTGGDAGNYSLTQPTGLTGDITKANQTITFAALPSKAVGDAPFDLTATSTSNLPITFTSSNTSVATIGGTNGRTVTIVGSGVTTITASQPGDGNYNAASDVARSLTVTVTLAQWSFEGDVTTPSSGSGDASLVGGTTASFAAGNPGRGWNTTTYPATGNAANNKTAGVQFSLSTSGYRDVILRYDHRGSNTAANRSVVQFTLDAMAATPVWVDHTTFTVTPAAAGAGDTWFSRSVDFSDVDGLDNNMNAAFRIVAAHSSGNDYVALRSTSSYGTTGTWRFDNVTFSGFELPPAAPSITSQPSNSTITYGANTTFTAAASGTPTPTVQWQTFVGGAWTSIESSTDGGIYTGFTTNTLTVTKPPVSLSARTYRALYTNASGSATTDSAMLTINRKALTITAQAKAKVGERSDPALTFTSSGLVTGDSVVGALTRTAGTDPGVYPINQGTVTNENNPNYDISYVGANLTITFALEINGGASQRSMITSLKLTFYEAITLSKDHLTLENLGVFTALATPSIIPTSQMVITPSSGSHTSFTITFDAGSGVNGSTFNGVTKRQGGTSGAATGNTLADGNYRLTINRGSEAGGTALPGNNVIGDRATDNFFRIYGDSNGDGLVNGTDFAALRAALATGAAYNAAFDFDGGGMVSSATGSLDVSEYTKRQNRRRRMF